MNYFAHAKTLSFQALLAQLKETENGLRCAYCGVPLPRKNAPCPRRNQDVYPHNRDRR